MILATGFCGERNALMAVIGLSFVATSFDIDVSENLYLRLFNSESKSSTNRDQCSTKAAAK